jgi:hypothetical protein
MGVLGGPFLIVSLLLAGAGAMKAYDPANTAGALRRVGLPVPSWVVRAGGAAELAIGLAAATTGTGWAAALVAASYALFTMFVAIALLRRLPVGSCGCFGKIDTPASWLHVVINACATGVATAVAIAGGDSLAAILRDQPASGVPFVIFVVTGVYLLFVALTALPQLLETMKSAPDA